MKVWVRNSKLNNQHSINTYNARLGFESCGLNSIDYAKLISARWSQLLSRPDELKF